MLNSIPPVKDLLVRVVCEPVSPSCGSNLTLRVQGQIMRYTHSCSSEKAASQLLFDLISRSATVQTELSLFLPLLRSHASFFKFCCFIWTKQQQNLQVQHFFVEKSSKSTKLSNIKYQQLPTDCSGYVWMWCDSVMNSSLPNIFSCARGQQCQVGIWALWFFVWVTGGQRVSFQPAWSGKRRILTNRAPVVW